MFNIDGEIDEYKWCKKHLPLFFAKLGIDFWGRYPGIINAHSSKANNLRYDWEKNGLPFHKGFAIYLLTYLREYGGVEVGDTPNGWVNPAFWVLPNKDRFLPILDEVERILEVSDISEFTEYNKNGYPIKTHAEKIR